MFHKQNSNIVSDDDLVVKRRRVIIWTNDDPILWHVYALFGFELNKYG